MKTITIGDKPLKDISPKQLLEIAKLEGVHLVFNHNGEDIWGEPEIKYFSPKMFHDTIVIDYQQKRLSDNFKGKTIVFFFNHKDISYHWHFKDHETSSSNRLKFESIRYLVQEGFDVPIY